MGHEAYRWTLGLYKDGEEGVCLCCLEGGLVISHPVYIDNLVDGIMLAAVHPMRLVKLLISVTNLLQWDTWWGYYGKMAGRKPRRVPMWVAQIGAVLSDTFKLKFAA